MNQAIVPFDYNGNAVRTVQQNGQLWFVAKDVCGILEIENSRDALSRLDDDEKGVVITDTLGGKQEVASVNESGLYNLIFTSRKAEAKAFRRWVTSEVLPIIRKRGYYAVRGNRAIQQAPVKALDAAVTFLMQLLAGGVKVPQTEVILRAKERGISATSVRRAKRILAVISVREYDYNTRTAAWLWQTCPPSRLQLGGQAHGNI